MVMLQNLNPPPDCPDYMVMNATVTEISKTQPTEIRGIPSQKEEGTQGMANLLKEVTPESWLLQ